MIGFEDDAAIIQEGRRALQYFKDSFDIPVEWVFPLVIEKSKWK